MYRRLYTHSLCSFFIFISGTTVLLTDSSPSVMVKRTVDVFQSDPISSCIHLIQWARKTSTFLTLRRINLGYIVLVAVMLPDPCDKNNTTKRGHSSTSWKKYQCECYRVSRLIILFLSFDALESRTMGFALRDSTTNKIFDLFAVLCSELYFAGISNKRILIFVI